MLAMLSKPVRKFRPTSLTSGLRLGSLALAAGAIGVVGLSSTDSVLEKSFTVAMARHAEAPTGDAKNQRSTTAISGSEDYWLGGLPSGAKRVAWSTPLAVGDRFTIAAPGASRSAPERQLTVVGVREANVAVGANGEPARLLLVEFRDDSLGPDAPLMRLIMDDALAASLKAGATLPRAL